MHTPKGAKAPVMKKDVTYKDLRALKIAKGTKKLPRGMRAHIDLGAESIEFKIPNQDVPALTISIGSYAEACLKADGFKLAD